MPKILLTATVPLALLINVLAINAFAADTASEEKDIYKKTNKAGVVEFTDRPDQGTKPIRVPTMNTYKQKPLPRTSTQKKPAEVIESYNQFAIASPLNDTEVRENAGNVSIQLNLDPPLKTGHTIKVIIDNDEKLSLTGSLLVFKFMNVSRGTHKVQAFILDAKQKMIQESAVVEFHLKRFIYKPPAPKAKP